MSTSFATLKARLLSSVDILPPAQAGILVNTALKDIYKSNDWGFLIKKDYIRTPNSIETGTAEVTKFSNIVTLDSVASALIMAITADDIQLTERQFRLRSISQNTGNNYTYNIIDYDVSDPSAVTLTLEEPFLDENNSSAEFQILKLYYNPPPIVINNIPIIDFKHWKFFISLKLHRQLWTGTTLEELNKFDPARNWSFTDDPRHVVAHPPAADTDFPSFELYPAPKFERVYQVIYQRKGLKLVEEADEIPATLDEELVVKRSEYAAYNWLLANSHKYPELKQSAGRFINLMGLTDNPNNSLAYPALLAKCIKEDEENFPKSYLGDYMRIPYIDSYIGNFTYRNEFESGGIDIPFSTAIINF